jgi:hypothetical protein
VISMSALILEAEKKGETVDAYQWWWMGIGVFLHVARTGRIIRGMSLRHVAAGLVWLADSTVCTFHRYVAGRDLGGGGGLDFQMLVPHRARV